MILQKFICDRCSNEIETEYINRICIEKANKLALEDLGDIDEEFSEAHFCDKCINDIKRFIMDEICGLPFVAPKEPDNKIHVHDPVVEVEQEQKPRRHDGAIKSEVVRRFKDGESIAKISRELNVNYNTAYGWAHE